MHNIVDLVFRPLLPVALWVDISWRLGGSVEGSVLVIFLESLELCVRIRLYLRVLRQIVEADELIGVIDQVIHLIVFETVTVESDQLVGFSPDSVLLVDHVPIWIFVIMVVDGLPPAFACLASHHWEE